MAESTSLAFRVFRFPFIAKLLALKRKAALRVARGSPPLLGQELEKGAGRPPGPQVAPHDPPLPAPRPGPQMRGSAGRGLCSFLPSPTCTHHDVAYSTKTLAAREMALRASLEMLTPSGSCERSRGEHKRPRGTYFPPARPHPRAPASRGCSPPP